MNKNKLKWYIANYHDKLVIWFDAVMRRNGNRWQ